MSVYELRYNVHAAQVSHYTDDPEEALRLYRYGLEVYESGSFPRHPPWIEEGHAHYEDVDRGHRDYGGIEGVLVTRRTLGKVLPTTLEFMVERRKVMRMLAVLSILEDN